MSTYIYIAHFVLEDGSFFQSHLFTSKENLIEFLTNKENIKEYLQYYDIMCDISMYKLGFSYSRDSGYIQENTTRGITPQLLNRLFKKEIETISKEKLREQLEK